MHTTALKSWIGVASFTILLSGRLVLYTTRSETLSNMDFIANEAQPTLMSFHPYKEGVICHCGNDYVGPTVSFSFSQRL